MIYAWRHWIFNVEKNEKIGRDLFGIDISAQWMHVAWYAWIAIDLCTSGYYSWILPKPLTKYLQIYSSSLLNGLHIAQNSFVNQSLHLSIGCQQWRVYAVSFSGCGVWMQIDLKWLEVAIIFRNS